MKRRIFLLALFAWVCGGAVACSPEDRDFVSPSGGTGESQHPDDGSEDDPNSPHTPGQSDDENDPTTQTMKLKLMIGSREFTATLADNAASRAFWDLLPLELDMIEMNGNEKYGNLPQSLPVDVHYPGTISTGDLLLWGNRTVVLFYKTFPSSYGYTVLGRLDAPEDLAEAVGRGNIRITFAR